MIKAQSKKMFLFALLGGIGIGTMSAGWHLIYYKSTGFYKDHQVMDNCGTHYICITGETYRDCYGSGCFYGEEQ